MIGGEGSARFITILHRGGRVFGDPEIVLRNIWTAPYGGSTCIGYKPGSPLASIDNWVTKLHNINLKFGPRVVPFALVPKLSTRLSHLHYHIALDYSTDFVRVTSVKYQKGVVLTYREPDT